MHKKCKQTSVNLRCFQRKKTFLKSSGLKGKSFLEVILKVSDTEVKKQNKNNAACESDFGNAFLKSLYLFESL